MLSQSALIQRFSAGATAGRASNLFIEDEVLYSYGHHFPLAVRREWGAGIAYLINADRRSISTGGHQRRCIEHLTPNVQIPFSALHAAGLTDYALPRRGLRISAHRSDRYFETCRHCGRDAVYNGSRGYSHADGSALCAEAEGKTASEHVLGAVVLEHEGRFYLSSIDEHEGWRARAYFLCELPRSVSSVEDAFASLVPEEVMRAQESGIEVRRQGDIFAIASDLPTRQIPGPSRRGFRVFDTAHVTTEARVNGALYIRGTLRHAPPHRRPQHRALALGKSWWIAVKNLALASWNAAGTVD